MRISCLLAVGTHLTIDTPPRKHFSSRRPYDGWQGGLAARALPTCVSRRIDHLKPSHPAPSQLLRLPSLLSLPAISTIAGDPQSDSFFRSIYMIHRHLELPISCLNLRAQIPCITHSSPALPFAKQSPNHLFRDERHRSYF